MQGFKRPLLVLLTENQEANREVKTEALVEGLLLPLGYIKMLEYQVAVHGVSRWKIVQ